MEDRPLAKLSDWHGGIEVAYRHAQRQASAYYTPSELFSAFLSSRYTAGSVDCKFSIKAGLGAVLDEEHATRLGGFAGAVFEKEWRNRWFFYMGADYSNVSHYSRLAMYTALSYRF